MGRIKEDSEERGIFAPYELAVLFPDESPGPWAYYEVYTCCFLLAATTGLCRGEILGCRRKRIDFDRKLIYVEEAKKVSEIGTPKWNRYREVPLIPSTIAALKKLLDESPFKDPDDFIFCNMQRQPRGFTWWKKNFTKTLDTLNWDRRGRNLTPHSFRHTVVSYLRSQGYDLDLIQKNRTFGWHKRREKKTRSDEYQYTLARIRHTPDDKFD